MTGRGMKDENQKAGYMAASTFREFPKRRNDDSKVVERFDCVTVARASSITAGILSRFRNCENVANDTATLFRTAPAFPQPKIPSSASSAPAAP
jgi:hypothetical protein